MDVFIYLNYSTRNSPPVVRCFADRQMALDKAHGNHKDTCSMAELTQWERENGFLIHWVDKVDRRSKAIVVQRELVGSETCTYKDGNGVYCARAKAPGENRYTYCQEHLDSSGGAD